MFYIGIDVAKYKHSCAVISEGGEKIFTHFDFANTTEGFSLLIKKLDAFGISSDCSRVCMESTGHYGYALWSHLSERGFEVCLANPFQTHNYVKAQTVRKVKNDALDALALAQWLLIENPTASALSPEETAELKSIARFRTFQSRIIGDCKRKVITLLDVSFPEYAPFFTDTFGKTSLAVLMRYPSAEALSHAHIDALTNLLVKSSRGKFSSDHASALRDLARNSFGVRYASEASAFQIRELIDQIEFTKKQMASAERKMTELLVKAATPITTIPGIGTVCAAIILGEIGDIARFSKSSQLVAYAGYDPSVFQSGQFSGTNNHISKRGSRYLRWAIWLAADRARMFDPMLREYYEKKRGEGKCHKVAMCAVARKLCNIIFAVLSTNQPYF